MGIQEGKRAIVMPVDLGGDFIVRRDDFRQCRFVASAIDAELAPGQVLFRVDRFALTSNNISYAAAGDMLDYWGFFPAEAGWGRIPAMGFADVVASRHEGVPEGQRVFGFFPMSHHLLIRADNVNPQQYVDGSEHRAKHAPAYRQYSPVATDPLYEESYEDATMLLRGLFMTSFLVDDFLAEDSFFGAKQFVIGSASSKTGLALAFQLAQRGRGRVIGLTSERNRAFVEGLGFYDAAVAYDALESIAADVPTVFVDHAGGDVVNAVHRHFGDSLKYSCVVGATHWDGGERANDLPGPKPTFFFAPAQIVKRSQEWGPAGLQERLGGAWTRFRDASDKWLEVVRGYGPETLAATYQQVLEGRAEPSQGHVLSLHPR